MLLHSLVVLAVVVMCPGDLSLPQLHQELTYVLKRISKY